MNNDRLLELLNNYIEYCEELKERESSKEKEYFYKHIIGMSNKELKYFGIELQGAQE